MPRTALTLFVAALATAALTATATPAPDDDRPASA
jgi:hypothetical protein